MNYHFAFLFLYEREIERGLEVIGVVNSIGRKCFVLM